MRMLEYLTGPDASEYWPVVLTGLAVAVQCSLLSVFVVLRQMSFVGHGVSHAALAGVGLAAVLGLSGNMLLMLVGFSCLVAAMSIWALTARRRSAFTEHDDTAIGIVLAASMALGAVLLSWREQHPLESVETNLAWEDVLFGSIESAQSMGAWLAWACCAIVGGVLYWNRRGFLLWLYDPTAARLGGVPTGAVRLVLMVLITGVIVVSVRLTGVVLVTALLILPGACALRVSSSLVKVFVSSVVFGVAGMVVGLGVAFEAGLPPGACVVLVMSGVYAAVRLMGR